MHDIQVELALGAVGVVFLRVGGQVKQEVTSSGQVQSKLQLGLGLLCPR